MSWTKVLIINISVFIVLLVGLEMFAGIGRVMIGKQFKLPTLVAIGPCEEMRTDVLLSHVPNHQNLCSIDAGYTDGEYVRYNVSSEEKPTLMLLGGSTTSGFYQKLYGQTYPKYLADLLASQYSVLNGGVGGYSSLQELYKLIRDGARINGLNTVISLNGSNELPGYHGIEEVRKSNHPFLTKIQFDMNLQQRWIDQRGSFSIYSLFPNLLSLTSYLKTELVPVDLKAYSNLSVMNPIELSAAERWERNVTRMHAVAKSQGVTYFVFLQPTLGLLGPQSLPTKGSPDDLLLNSLSRSYLTDLRLIFNELKKRCATIEYCFDISDKVPPTGHMYSDPRHHNADGNRILASVIADRLSLVDNSIPTSVDHE